MDVDDAIRALLAGAGILMEDASARMVLEPGDVAARVAELRTLAGDLLAAADAVERLHRRARNE